MRANGQSKFIIRIVKGLNDNDDYCLSCGVLGIRIIASTQEHVLETTYNFASLLAWNPKCKRRLSLTLMMMMMIVNAQHGSMQLRSANCATEGQPKLFVGKPKP